MQHPYYSYTLEQARHLGASLASSKALDPNPPAVSDEVAREAIENTRKTCGFNWITGRVASELLQTAITGKPHFTT